MSTSQQFSITLPDDMAEAVRAKVAGGEYASESEVISDALEALMAHDRAAEDWLRNVMVPAYEAHLADPSRVVSVEHVREHLAALHARTLAEQ